MYIFIPPFKKRFLPVAQSTIRKEHPSGIIVFTEAGDKRVAKTTKSPMTRPWDMMRKRGAHDPDLMKVGRNGWANEEADENNNNQPKMELTSRNLSHLPVSHLSSKKFPLSERAETRPKATAHTHSKTTLSIWGNTTTSTRRKDIKISLEDSVSAKNTSIGTPLGGAWVRKTAENSELALPCRRNCTSDCMWPLPFSVTTNNSSLSLSLYVSVSLSLTAPGCLCAAEHVNAHRTRALRSSLVRSSHQGSIGGSYIRPLKNHIYCSNEFLTTSYLLQTDILLFTEFILCHFEM